MGGILDGIFGFRGYSKDSHRLFPVSGKTDRKYFSQLNDVGRNPTIFPSEFSKSRESKGMPMCKC